jgi:histidinol dehydrogenase
MIAIQRFSSSDADFAQKLEALRAFDGAQDAAIDQTVAAILADVRERGDAAVLEYTRRFDRVSARSLAELELPRESLEKALQTLPEPERTALETAAQRIRAYHRRQLQQSWQYEETEGALAGTLLGQKVTPLDRVGLYVPGGKAAYPSSVLMNALPAKIAGVGELIMVVPTPDGEKNPLVLAAAAAASVDRVFRIGGAQAVGALAYGTRTIPRVDKIVGPGNAYVAAAKRRVFGAVGIDMLAGPSEILVVCDGGADPDWMAMDLFSQAEHDELAQAILLCPDAAHVERVAGSIEKLLPAMPRREIIRAALEKRGALIVVRDLDEACEIANRIAPEHLELAVADAELRVGRIHHAGAIFIGPYSSEALGDYCAGPNHVLPTSGSARFSSPLGVYDFQKRSSLIRVSRAAAGTLGRVASVLAAGEGLSAHARSAEYRIGADDHPKKNRGIQVDPPRTAPDPERK